MKKEIDCKICKGKGARETKVGGEEMEITCGICDGEGKIEPFIEEIERE